MLSPETILTGLTAIANGWRWLAIAWHVLLGALLVLLVAGWRPSARLVAYVLVAPVISVSLLAWLSGNPFNATVFAILAATLIVTAARVSNTSVRFGSFAAVAPGVASIMFGSTYPHFVQAASWTTFMYASPFGLLPCPTLSVVIGITLLLGIFRPRVWNTTLVVTGLFYGAVGVFRLGVVLDWGLLFASTLLAATAMRDHADWRSVRATRTERRRWLPGDDFIRDALATLTHAITIGGPPQAVWPWLIQMGAGTRAGWYSYDLVDNGRRASATRLAPQLQDITIGTVFPALPGVTEGFVVLAFDPCRSLILGWSTPGGEPMVTWAFVLETRAGDSTRLIVRVRGAQGYRFHGLPPRLSKVVVRLVHFLMQRKQLLGIARRVESSHMTPSDAVSLPEAERRRA